MYEGTIQQQTMHEKVGIFSSSKKKKKKEKKGVTVKPNKTWRTLLETTVTKREA